MKDSLKIYFIVFAILILTYLEYLLLINFHKSYLLENFEATVTPLTGHAWWRAWQNRLLAGWIMSSIQRSSEDAYRIFVFVMCVGINFLTPSKERPP